MKLNKLFPALLVGALAVSSRPVFAAAPCGADILNTASVTMWSGPIDQIGYALSYNVSASVRIVCPVTGLVKYARPSLVSAGGNVTFFVCVDNQRIDGSVWNVTVTDRMPDGLGFVAFNPESYVGSTVGANLWGGTITTSWAASLAGPWTAGAPVAGQQDPLFLRWVISAVGPLRTACVTFSAQIL